MAYVEPSTRSLEEEVTLEEWNQDIVDNIIAIKAQIDALTAEMMPVGAVKAFPGAYAPTGWVVSYGTIGDQYSGASTRANADCESLFTLLWDSMADAQAPVVEGRGGSAAADWAAHKRITLPDGRGRVVAGKDNMGGSAASRLTSGGSGVDGATLGATGGAETQTLTQAQTPAHTHTATTSSDGAHTHTITGYTAVQTVERVAGTTPYGVNSPVTTASGGSHTHTLSTSTVAAEDHANVQPTLVVTLCVKL